MLKPTTAILLAAVLMNGCAGRSSPDAVPHSEPAPAPSLSASPADNRMNDPALLAQDRELHLGDAGIGDGPKVLQQLVRTVPNPAIAPLNGSYANNVISFGSHFLGTRYEYGSDRDDPSTFDCSDFTRYAFLGSVGMDLPKDSRKQAEYVNLFGTRQYRVLTQARPGDLLFFMDYKGPKPEDYRGVNPADARITHVGIYMGNGNILHTASQATGGVRIDTLFGKHLEWRFIQGGGVLP